MERSSSGITLTDNDEVGLRTAGLHTTNCKRPNTIHILHCTLCRKQYVQESQKPLGERFYEHIGHHPQKTNPMLNYYNSPTHNYTDHLKIAIIETSFRNSIHRRNKQLFIISKFNMLMPFGINAYGDTLPMLLESQYLLKT